jgi:hypothetical protein
METLPLYLALSLTTVAGLTILGLIALKAFRAWIDLKQIELNQRLPSAPSTAQRIDVADLKERIRKLEAIASGVDI